MNVVSATAGDHEKGTGLGMASGVLCLVRALLLHELDRITAWGEGNLILGVPEQHRYVTSCHSTSYHSTAQHSTQYNKAQMSVFVYIYHFITQLDCCFLYIIHTFPIPSSTPYPTLAYPTLPYLTLPYPTLPYPVFSYLTVTMTSPSPSLFPSLQDRCSN